MNSSVKFFVPSVTGGLPAPGPAVWGPAPAAVGVNAVVVRDVLPQAAVPTRTSATTTALAKPRNQHRPPLVLPWPRHPCLTPPARAMAAKVASAAASGVKFGRRLPMQASIHEWGAGKLDSGKLDSGRGHRRLCAVALGLRVGSFLEPGPAPARGSGTGSPG